jgi:hypothetical protein
VALQECLVYRTLVTAVNETASKAAAEAERALNIVGDLPRSIQNMLYLLIAIIAIPVILDLIFTHIRQIRQTKQETVNSLKGIPGLYRALMTFGLILIVGLIVVYLTNLITFHIDETSPNVDALLNILQNLAAILGTALATVIAFYFGMRGSERITERALAERGQPPAGGQPLAGGQPPAGGV